jgi:3-deoxy-D-manno-octulosonic-acid transferase
VGKRLPDRTRHQFAPLDSARYLRRFLRHWLPNAAVFVESELWPNMLRQARAQGVPLALVNARISDNSARNWARFPGTARTLLGAFRLIHCQDARTARHLEALGARRAVPGVNLKSLSGPLAYDTEEVARLRREIGARPLWLASSTHPGEEEIVLSAQTQVLKTRPDALLVLVPRHPERAGEIMGKIGATGLSAAQRSKGERPHAACAVYLADTLGETGLWYALSPITCLAGSFTPVGGHNPFEVAHAGSALLHGPLYANFAEAYPALHAAGAAREVEAEELADAVRALMEDDAARDTLAGNARAFATAQDDALAEIAQDLSNALGLR